MNEDAELKMVVRPRSGTDLDACAQMAREVHAVDGSPPYMLDDDFRGFVASTDALVPRSWGGSDDLANLAAICTGGATDHHAKLVPHGPWALTGNPNQPHGLRLERHDHHDSEQPHEHSPPSGPAP